MTLRIDLASTFFLVGIPAIAASDGAEAIPSTMRDKGDRMKPT